MLLAFSHIPKTGGSTLETILRRNFGRHHISVLPRRTPRTVYTPNDLHRDVRLFPSIKSLSGHSLKPFVYFGEFETEMRWHTVLRDPIKRYVSLYQHQFTRGKADYALPFTEWMESFGRRNQMVRWIAGTEDVDAAKQIIEEKFAAIGLLEFYDESLLIMKDRAGLDWLDLTYGRPKNTAPDQSVRKVVEEEIQTYRDDIMERNDLDCELYEFVRTELWPIQVEAYGADRLAQDKVKLSARKPSFRGTVRVAENRFFRNIIYKPVAAVERRLVDRRSP